MRTKEMIYLARAAAEVADAQELGNTAEAFRQIVALLMQESERESLYEASNCARRSSLSGMQTLH
jgi:hypothetical protein